MRLSGPVFSDNSREILSTYSLNTISARMSCFTLASAMECMCPFTKDFPSVASDERQTDVLGVLLGGHSNVI